MAWCWPFGGDCGGSRAGPVNTASFWENVENLPQIDVQISSASESLVNTATFWENVESTGIGTRDLVSTASFWDEAEGNLRFPAVTGTQGRMVYQVGSYPGYRTPWVTDTKYSTRTEF